MSDKDYTKREHDTMFDGIEKALQRIEAQVLKTNGRVTVLERVAWALGGAVGVFGLIESEKIFALFR